MIERQFSSEHIQEEAQKYCDQQSHQSCQLNNIAGVSEQCQATRV
jgi:hypothetical protein